MRLDFRFVSVCVLGLFLGGLSQAQSTFSNTNPISIATSPADGSPYPSQIAVNGLSGTVSAVTVKLNGWTDNGSNAFPGDRDFMLVGPTGAAFEFLGGCSSFNTFSNITITFADSASSQCSGAALASGTYLPTNRLDGFCTSFPGGAPASSNCAGPNGSATFASVFGGTAPNGTWSLYVFDGSALDSAGSISSGWTLTITLAAAAPTTTTVSSGLNPSFASSPNNSVTLTATVKQGSTAVTQGTVTFSEGATVIGSDEALNGSGQAQLTYSFTTEGNHAIKAQYNGTASFGVSLGTLTQEVDNHTTQSGSTFCDTGSFTFNTNGGSAEPASVYPQHVYVSGLSGTVSAVTLQLPGITHNFPEDLDFLLTGPTGTFVPLAKAGGSGQVSAVTVTLSDAAGSPVAQSSALSAGTFLPSDYNTTIFFPSPAPVGPYNYPATIGNATFATSFAGISPNGTWGLYAYDHAAGDTGLVGGYCLTFTTSSAAATTTAVTASPSGQQFLGDQVTFTATVTSGGSPVTQGTVTFDQNGSVLGGPTTLDSNGHATFITSSLPEGIHVITALYSGVPGSYNVSSGTVQEEIDHATTISGLTYCNPGGITIPSNALGMTYPATPYPSRVFVTNLPGTVSKVTATLKTFTHATPVTDQDMLLTGPTGTNIVFWGDAGGDNAVSSLNVTIDDSAGSQIPSGVGSGTYKPTANSASVSFPTPAPGPSFAAPAGSQTMASAFQNVSGNGIWSFYLLDADQGSGGSVGQVCLNFTENPVSVTATTESTDSFTQDQQNVQFTLNIQNNGTGPTGDPGGSNPLTVTDTLNSAFSFVSGAGTGWNCGASGQVVTCTNDSAVAQGASYPTLTLTLNVSATATPGQVSNTFNITGGAGVTAASSNTGTVTIVPAPVLSVTKSHTSTFTQGSTAEWDITVKNTASGGSTSGMVTVSDALPSGYSVANFGSTASSWTCGGTGTVTCTSSVAVSGGSNLPVIQVIVNVAADSPILVTNTAHAWGGGDLTHTNSGNAASGSDTVPVHQTPASVSVAAGSGQSTAINTAFTYPLQAIVRDAGSSPISGVTVTFTAPGSGASGTFLSGLATSDGSTNSSGVATATTFKANSTSGAYNVVASVYGLGSTASFGLTNSGLTQTITFNAIANQLQGTTLNLLATASSTLTVSFGSLTTGVCTVSGTVATLSNPGPCTIQATQLGNTTYAAAQPVSRTFTVLPLPKAVSYSVVFGLQKYNLVGAARTTDLPWKVTGISVTFSGPITAANINSLSGVTATGLSGLGTATLTWTIGPLTNGVFSTGLAASGANGIQDANGTYLGNGTAFTQNFSVLYGDYNGDGVVSAADLVLVNGQISQPYNALADLNGDGVVNSLDVSIARSQVGATLK